MTKQEEGDPPSQEAEEGGVHTAQGQERAGDVPRVLKARGPSPAERGEPPVRQCALPAHGMPNQEEGNPPRQEAEEEGTPLSSVCSQRTAFWDGGGPRTPLRPKGPHPNSVRSQRTSCRYGLQPKGEGGHPPSRRARPLCAAYYRIWGESPKT